jgi:polysaccharide pyruvyl transferase WcaK-like protein
MRQQVTWPGPVQGAVGASPVVAYLGWAGRGNMGDDAILRAMEQAVPGATFTCLPLYPAETARFLVAPAGARRVRHGLFLLGGGTVIGRSSWRMHVHVGLGLVRTRPALMVGAGVEDPDFQGRHSCSGPGELQRWTGILRAFESVTVRGPRSAELLADVGVDARVVGDPALLLEPKAGASPPEPGVIGVNLGYGDDIWGHDQVAVIRAVAGAVSQAIADGYSVRFLVANPEDLVHSQACAAFAGLGREPDIRITVDPEEFLTEVSQCQAFIGQRLHAVVLATAAAVPSVMLEYQPKCLDFMRSVGRAEWSVRTDALQPAVLAGMVGELASKRSEHAAEITREVARLRQDLERETQTLQALVAPQQLSPTD